MKYVFLMILSVFCFSSIIGCNSDSQDYKEIILTEINNGENVKVNPGTHIIISLQETPSTGYHYVLEEGINPLVLEMINDEVEINSEDMPGAPGVRNIEFVVKDHEATQKIILHLFSHDNSKIVNTIQYNIIILKNM